jgi:hypothetical protein
MLEDIVDGEQSFFDVLNDLNVEIVTRERRNAVQTVEDGDS